MKRLAAALLAVLVPTAAAAGEITLWNTSGGPVELRAVRAGTVTIEDKEKKTFLYPAENGDFRVFVRENKCDYIFLFEAAEDATFQFVRGPLLFRLPAGAEKPLEGEALRAAQPEGWPLAPPDMICE